MSRERARAVAGGWTKVYAYFAATCRQLSHSPVGTPTPAARSPETAAAGVFELLSGRSFTYLARHRCETYRSRIEAALRHAAEAGVPASFYYDIGGGYRASLAPGTLPLAFGPGLGDLLMLYQVRMFLVHAQALFPTAIRFRLVVDNLCAYYVNGIALDQTERYCSQLRDILRHFRLHAVELLVESEHVPMAEYERRFESALAQTSPPDVVAPRARENVERFCGRRMDNEQARRLLARYTAGSAATETGLADLVDGIRMTQRATPETFAFRSFPGSDARIQCGEVGLGLGRGNRVRPMLLTSVNRGRYRTEPIDITEWGVPHVATIRYLY